MTTDPNELAQTPGTPTGQELTAVAASQPDTVPTPGTPSADQQKPQGDSVANPSPPSTAQQGQAATQPGPPAGQLGGANFEQKVQLLWDDFLERIGQVNG